MRIVHYQPQLRGRESGTSNAGRGWCEALARRGVEVLGLVDSADLRRPPPEGVETVALAHSPGGAARVPIGIAPHLRDADVLVMHGGWLLGNVAAGLTAARAGVPFVVTSHGVYLPEVFGRRTLVKRAWGSALERPHLRRAAAVHVSFPDEQVGLHRELGVDVPAIVAPNGIDPPEARWDGGSGGYLLWLGRFDVRTKGLDLLVAAVAGMAPGERPRVRLHGPDWRNDKRRLRTMVRDLGLDRWIAIGDPVHGDDKGEVIARARGCVYPSRWDACPVAVMEAAAAGVPTVVARYPLGTFLAGRSAAYQVDPEPRAIAAGIASVLGPAAGRVGATAADVARRHLSWDAVASSWLDQLGSVLAGAVSVPSDRPER